MRHRENCIAMKHFFFSALLMGIGSLGSPVSGSAVSASTHSASMFMAPDADDIDAALNNYSFSARNQYPIVFSQSSENNWKCSGESFYISAGNNGILSASVEVDQNATFTYTEGTETGYSPDRKNLLVTKVDGEIVVSQHYSYAQHRYFIELAPGKHTIEWVANADCGSMSDIRNIAVEKTPIITVSLLEPGSLGTEVLHEVDGIKDVRKLVIKGKMNDDDWAKITMMAENLYSLDLTDADVTVIPDRFFSRVDNNWEFLHEIKLPKNLKEIGESAFYYTNIENIDFPSSIQKINSDAFRTSFIKSAVLPETCLEIGSDVFTQCYELETVKLSSGLKTISSSMFALCYSLKPFELPAALEVVESGAFRDCANFNATLPLALKKIGQNAFNGTNQNNPISDLIVPKNVTLIDEGAFANTKYTYAELPVGIYNSPLWVFNGMDCLKTIRLNSPTVLGAKDEITNNNFRENITLQVPSYLVTSYKLDDYWYNFGAIEGFDTETIKEWTINTDLILGAQDRMLGTPSINIPLTGSLKINGDDAMPLDNLHLYSDPDNKKYGRIFSNSDGVTVAGNLDINMRFGISNRWYFISLPYDMKVSDMAIVDNPASKAVRYYDGANRAENGASGSWKNFSVDDVIPAGTGFIFQVSQGGWWNFPSVDNDSKQYMTSYKMFVKQLAANYSENAADCGWNLVGNPYQTWYNIHKLNFIAPITVRNGNNYEAYSIIDDDYAIAPNQAFFVQCPDGVSEISFPLDGRQMTSVIETQNSAPSKVPVVSKRQLIDITVSNGEQTDRTRVVLNNEASDGYEAGRDAAKFMGEGGVPQLYTYDAGNNKYAINERPEDDGIVKLGFVAAEDGVFTISLIRNNAAQVMLIDNETGVTVDLMQQDYGFTANAGIHNYRFELRTKSSTTSIDDTLSQTEKKVRTVWGGVMVNGNTVVYLPDGKKVAESNVAGDQYISLPKGLYIIKVDGLSVKVNVAY